MSELGKFLTWVLRHEPDAIGIELDPAGWVTIERLLAAILGHGRACTRAEFDECVATDGKRRFTISADGLRIRAAQGHSLAIDLASVPVQPPEQLFHGTPTRFVAAILSGGLDKRERHDVHLSGESQTAIEVGRRRGRPVILQIDAGRMHRDGFEFRRSDNGVWLTDRVPPEYLSRLASQADSRHESSMPESLDLALPDGRIAALAWGPAQGRPVLALHGWLDNAASFTNLAPRLCEALDLRIVALDMPGHGYSEHKRGPYHFIDSVADTIHAADALGWDRFSLLGHSMGAGISTLVAGAVPDRIDRCVLIEGLGPMTDEPSEAARRLGRSLRVEARQPSKVMRLYPDAETAVERLREAAIMKPESARLLIDRGLEQRDGGWTWRADPRLRVDSRLRLSEAHVHAFLTAIRAPVLLISATHGWPHDPAVTNQRIAAVQQLTHVSLPGNHHIHLDEPQAVAAAIIPYLTARPEQER